MKIRNMLTTLTIAGATALFAAAPLSAQATQSICKDGTTDATVGRGACGHHGGVDKAAMKAATKSAKAAEKATAKAAKVAAPPAAMAAPATASAKAGAQVTCADGSMGTAGRGACGHHGGVMKAGAKAAVAAPVVAPAPKPSPMAAAPATAPRASRAAASAQPAVAGNGSREDNNPAGAIAKCKDGMYSHAAHRTGACGHHGGVAQWMGQ